MSNRRLQKRRPYGVLAAAALVLVGGGTAVAIAANSGGDGRSTVVGSAGNPAVADAPTPGPAGPSGSARPSGSASASASASSNTTASAGTSAKAGGSTGRSASAAAPGAATAPVAVAPPRAALPGQGPGVYTGTAFDTCTAPKLATMNAWRGASPYGAAAVYIGGQNRGCAQPQLTGSWVRSVSASGWKLIPLYVGAQPPCQTSGNPERITAANAASLGASDGADAVARASALGMRSGSAVYLDMEAYSTSDAGCVQAVLTYVQSWDRTLHTKGYWAGFYGFSKSSAAAMADAVSAGATNLPDALWYARYDGVADTTSAFPFSGGLWSGHRRGHQYAVNLKQTFAGAAVTVDSSAWDAPVAVVG